MNPLRVLALLACLACALVATMALAQPGKSSHAGDAAAGGALHDKDCVACHVRRVGGDGTAMYTRPDRKVTSAAKLEAQVAACNSQLATGYFPEEEAHIAAYLNLRHYKFGP